MMPIGAPICIPFVVTSVAVFVNKSPRLTHEWWILVGSPPGRNALNADQQRPKRGRATDDDGDIAAVRERFRLRAEKLGKTPGRPPQLFESFVEKVCFECDRSFADPVRCVHSPPFLTSGEGWGEHCVSIRVHFKPELELPPFVVLHSVLLHNTLPTPLSLGSELLFSEPPKRLVAADDPARPCISQRRDSIILMNARRSVYRKLLEACSSKSSKSSEWPLPAPLQAALGQNSTLAVDAEKTSAALLELAAESLEREATEMLRQIQEKDRRIEELLERSKQRISEQAVRCERLAKKVK
jgi:hypothetical protein